MTNKKTQDLPQRVLISSLITILVTGFILLAQYPPLRWIFTGGVALFAALALREYYQLLRRKDLAPPVVLGIVLSVLYIFAVFYRTQGPYVHWGALWDWAPDILLGISFFSCFAVYAFGKHPAIVHIATAFLGIIYIAIPCGMIVHEMYFFTFSGQKDIYFQGTWWVVYLIAVTKSADIGGYFIGRFFGRYPLAPRISPKKTVEGGIGGLVASTAMSIFIIFLGKRYGHVFQPVGWTLSIGLGIAMGVLGQLGDLAESLLKRDADVKDSNAIPGVGGVLDMADSLLFTTPVVYIVLRMLYAHT